MLKLLYGTDRFNYLWYNVAKGRIANLTFWRIIMKKLEKLFYIACAFLGLSFSAANAYELAVNNYSDKNYSKISVILTPVNFDAHYGRFDINDLVSGENRTESVGDEYLQIPMTGLVFPSNISDANINLTIIALPEEGEGSLQIYKSSRIVKLHKIIRDGILIGLSIPNISILINDAGINRVRFIEQYDLNSTTQQEISVY